MIVDSIRGMMNYLYFLCFLVWSIQLCLEMGHLVEYLNLLTLIFCFCIVSGILTLSMCWKEIEKILIKEKQEGYVI